jgi:hypothetical protein
MAVGDSSALTIAPAYAWGYRCPTTSQGGRALRALGIASARRPAWIRPIWRARQNSPSIRMSPRPLIAK